MSNEVVVLVSATIFTGLYFVAYLAFREGSNGPAAFFAFIGSAVALTLVITGIADLWANSIAFLSGFSGGIFGLSQVYLAGYNKAVADTLAEAERMASEIV